MIYSFFISKWEKACFLWAIYQFVLASMFLKLNIFGLESFLKLLNWYSSSLPEVFLGKGVLKVYSKITGEHPCRSVISIKLLYNFIGSALLHRYSPINLLHIFRTAFLETPLDSCFCISSITLRFFRFLGEYLFLLLSHLEICREGL